MTWIHLDWFGVNTSKIWEPLRTYSSWCRTLLKRSLEPQQGNPWELMIGYHRLSICLSRPVDPPVVDPPLWEVLPPLGEMVFHPTRPSRWAAWHNAMALGGFPIAALSMKLFSGFSWSCLRDVDIIIIIYIYIYNIMMNPSKSSFPIVFWQTGSENDSHAPSFSFDFQSSSWSRIWFYSLILWPHCSATFCAPLCAPGSILDANPFLKKTVFPLFRSTMGLLPVVFCQWLRLRLTLIILMYLET